MCLDVAHFVFFFTYEKGRKPPGGVSWNWKGRVTRQGRMGVWATIPYRVKLRAACGCVSQENTSLGPPALEQGSEERGTVPRGPRTQGEDSGFQVGVIGGDGAVQG